MFDTLHITCIGPNEVSIRNADCIKGVLGASGLPKGPMWEGRHMHPSPPSLVGCRDPVVHAKRRRPWTRAFNTASLKNLHPTIAKRAHQLVDGLAGKKGQVADLEKWFSFFS